MSAHRPLCDDGSLISKMRCAVTGAVGAGQDGCLNIVMEYASEGDLSEVIARRASERRPLSEDDIMFWWVPGWHLASAAAGGAPPAQDV